MTDTENPIDATPETPNDTATPDTIVTAAAGNITASSGVLTASEGTVGNVDVASAPVATAPPIVTEPPIKGALVALTEGTPEHETFSQEFHEFLTIAKRDTAEIIAWLRARL